MNAPQTSRHFGQPTFDLDAAIHRLVMLAANRAKVRRLVGEARYYRKKLLTTDVLFSTHCREWEEAAMSTMQDLREAYAGRHEVV